MTEILIILITGALNIGCFFIGAKVGQSVAKDKEIRLPKLNPMDMYREHREKKEAQRENEKLETVLRNLERYDGTDAGQEDIPR